MPKIGSYKIPNHDIETVVELIDEAYSRVQVKTGELDEETFREEVLQRHGGTYSRYRYSLQQYGFIERQHGADEVEIKDLFVEVADPIPQSARGEAISEAVGKISILRNMFEEGFEPDFKDQNLRVWLIQDLNVPRDEAGEDEIQDLRRLYEPAYPYFQQLEETEPDKPEDSTKEMDAGEEKPPTPDEPMGDLDNLDDENSEFEEFRIGNRYVRLPRENIEKEWELLKTTVDAYVNQITESEDE